MGRFEAFFAGVLVLAGGGVVAAAFHTRTPPAVSVVTVEGGVTTAPPPCKACKGVREDFRVAEHLSAACNEARRMLYEFEYAEDSWTAIEIRILESLVIDPRGAAPGLEDSEAVFLASVAIRTAGRRAADEGDEARKLIGGLLDNALSHDAPEIRYNAIVAAMEGRLIENKISRSLSRTALQQVARELVPSIEDAVVQGLLSRIQGYSSDG